MDLMLDTPYKNQFKGINAKFLVQCNNFLEVYFTLFHLNVGFFKASVKHSYNFDVMKLRVGRRHCRSNSN